MRKKKCKNCGIPFEPIRQFQSTCSTDCAIAKAKQDRIKLQKKSFLKKKQAFKQSDRSYQLKLAQAAFNKFIRLRDNGQPCISCQRVHGGQNHAGHYRSIGAYPSLRFTEDNCHLQCAPCNNHKSGNPIDYRINLIKKIGLDRVEWLEKDHPSKKLSIQEIIEIKKTYKEKVKL